MVVENRSREDDREYVSPFRCRCNFFFRFARGIVCSHQAGLMQLGKRSQLWPRLRSPKLCHAGRLTSNVSLVRRHFHDTFAELRLTNTTKSVSCSIKGDPAYLVMIDKAVGHQIASRDLGSGTIRVDMVFFGSRHFAKGETTSGALLASFWHKSSWQ